MTHKIFDANDKALEEHFLEPKATFKTHRERISFDWNKIISPIHRQRDIPFWKGVEGSEKPVTAYVDAGRWLANCECRNSEYVTAKDPIFFCHECGNKSVEGKSRPVIFPSDKFVNMIESALLKREVVVTNEDMKYSPIHRARNARPVTRPRNWKPYEG